MKIFRQESGIDTVYVQLHALRYLHDANLEIPDFIYEKLREHLVENYPDTQAIDDANKSSFIKFRDKSAVNYFKKQSFILDFDNYILLEENELEQKLNKLYGYYSKILLQTQQPKPLVNKIQNMAEKFELSRVACNIESLKTIHDFRRKHQQENNNYKDVLIYAKKK